MYHSKLFQLLAALEPNDHEQIKRYVESPFFKVRTASKNLYIYFYNNFKKKEAITSTNTCWEIETVASNLQAKPKSIQDEASHLLKIVKDVLIQIHLQNDTRLQKRLLMQELKLRRLANSLADTVKAADKELEEDTQRALKYYKHRAVIEEMRGMANLMNGQAFGFYEWKQVFDIKTVADHLRMACLQQTNAFLFGRVLDKDWIKALLNYVREHTEINQEPIIIFYFWMLRCITENDKILFQRLIVIIERYKKYFEASELREAYRIAENICAIAIIKGESWHSELLTIYQQSLTSGMLHEDFGELRPVIYKNAIHLAIREGDLAWASDFCENQKKYLPADERTDFYRLCRAIIDFEQKNYNKVVSGTINLTFKTISFECNRRALLLCAYYELLSDSNNFKYQDKYADLFEKNIINFSIYLKKHKNGLATLQAAQYAHFLKFLQFLKKYSLIFDISQKKMPEIYIQQLKKLISTIQNTTVLLYKSWLLQKVEELSREGDK